MARVIVIGGGVSGLSTAHSLMQAGMDVEVLERQVVAGGNAISERLSGGFLMEHGPTTFNASFPDAVAQIDALGLLGSASDLGPGVKRRYLRDQGRLTGIAASPTGFLRSNYLSPRARLRILLEGFKPRKTDDAEETIHAFASRRFGPEFAEKVIEPMAAGLFMGDSQRLSLGGTFARLAEMEQENGSITRAILRAKKGSQPGRHLYSWKGGIAAIPQALIRALGAKVKTGITVLNLRKMAWGFEVRTSAGTLSADAVVLAVQPHVAASLLEGPDPEGAAAAGGIHAPPVNVAFLGYRRDQVGHKLDGLGFLSTKDPSRILSGAQFLSTMYQGRAPDGHVAISAYAGGRRNPELARLDDTTLVAEMHRELAQLLDIKGAPVLTRTRRWALGLPQYELGHKARVAVLADSSKRIPGLFVTGNFLHGVSVANCLTAGAETAALLRADLADKPAKRKRHTG